MKWALYGIAGIAIAGIVGFAVIAWRGEIEPRPAAASAEAAADPEQIEAGARLALLGNCAGCHTVEGADALTGGLPIETPFGTVYSTNITPDRATGIGDWSLAAYTRAMREGVDREGRHLYPAFPYEYFARITDEDLADLYAWNMAQPAVAADVPANELTFPANFRPLLAGWKLLFHEDSQFTADPAQSELWNAGAYLAEGLGHCGACHVPRNLLGGAAVNRADEGGEASEWWAPPLTPANPAPNVWTEASLAAYLRTGGAPGHGVAAGPMASVVHDSLALVPEADSAALAHYLADKMAGPSAPPTDPAARPGLARAALDTDRPPMGSAAFEDGARLFSANCTTCHHRGGPSAGRVFPDLAEITTVAGPDPRNLVQVVLWGIGQDAGSHDGYMPRFADELTDTQIAAIAAYLRNDTVTADTVARLRAGRRGRGWTAVRVRIPRHGRDASTTRRNAMTRTPNRRLVLGGMIALHALALARVAPGQTPLPSRTGPIGAEDFMALSQRVTGHDELSPTLGARILEVLTENGRSQALQDLYGVASGSTADAPEDQDDIVRLLLHGWYLGRIEIDGDTHLTGYEQILMGRVTADILPLRSYCGGAMGFWVMPPDVGPLPLRGARP